MLTHFNDIMLKMSYTTVSKHSNNFLFSYLFQSCNPTSFIILVNIFSLFIYHYIHKKLIGISFPPTYNSRLISKVNNANTVEFSSTTCSLSSFADSALLNYTPCLISPSTQIFTRWVQFTSTVTSITFFNGFMENLMVAC